MAKLAKDIAAGAVLIAAVNAVLRRLPRVRRQGRRPLVDPARPAAAGAVGADARRARVDRDHRDRHQGLHGPRHAAARRAARPGMQRSRSPGGWPRRTSRANSAPLPGLVDRADHGVSRRADPRRVGRALSAGGRRTAPSSALSPRSSSSRCSRERGLVLKAEEVAQQAYAPYSNYLVGAVVRTTDGREFAGVERRERGLSAAAVRGEDGDRRRGDRRATGRATSRRSAITASPCGGCRQWLYEWRMPEV